MKKILALLLVLCMTVGLLACAKPKDDTATNEGSKETTPIREDINTIDESDLALESGDDNSNDAYINPEKYAGKKLQIAGLESDTFEDLDNMGVGSYNWMIRAAIDEWATLNQVEVTYESGNASTDILATVNSGTKLDIVLGSNELPGLANLKITQGFTQEQHDKLAKICGAGFVDAMNYKGASHGVIYPWTGNSLFYYNRTMFETYGAKTPAQYFMEDNWNWDTLELVLESVTKDFDGNGKIDGKDTFGIGGNLLHAVRPMRLVEDPQTGKLTGTIGTEAMYKRYLDLVYKGRYQTLSVAQEGTHYIEVTSTPRSLVAVADGEWYNFEHLYKTLDNGDIIEATISPAWNYGERQGFHVNFTPRFMAMLSTCDEPEAAFDMLCYVLKVGMRYISDYSVGLYKSEYEGIRGASEFSKGWLENFASVCEDRRAAFAEIEDWDVEHYEKMIKAMFAEDTTLHAFHEYTGEVVSYNVENMPAASAIPVLVAEQDAWIAKYNELYAN